MVLGEGREGKGGKASFERVSKREWEGSGSDAGL